MAPLPVAHISLSLSAPSIAAPTVWQRLPHSCDRDTCWPQEKALVKAAKKSGSDKFTFMDPMGALGGPLVWPGMHRGGHSCMCSLATVHF